MTINTAQGANIQTLAMMLIINLVMPRDPSPKLTSIALAGGPANDKVQLSWREESKGRFRLEYPVSVPLLGAESHYYPHCQRGRMPKVTPFKIVGVPVHAAAGDRQTGWDSKPMIPASDAGVYPCRRQQDHRNGAADPQRRLYCDGLL